MEHKIGIIGSGINLHEAALELAKDRGTTIVVNNVETKETYEITNPYKDLIQAPIRESRRERRERERKQKKNATKS